MSKSLKPWGLGLLMVLSALAVFIRTGHLEAIGIIRALASMTTPPPTETVYLLEVRPLSQGNHLKRLGLTPKKPIVIKDPLTGAEKKIHGRFLHVTDLHPDPYYKEGSKISDVCHGGKGDAGKYGDAVLGCDSPMRLVEETMDWIADNLKDEIDFIVWTGDNMRHDNDRNYPRYEDAIFAMNEKIADMMSDRFGGLPIPSLGNNDVYPHNLFATGPTFQTREFYKVWKQFVPQAQLNIFNKGVYYFEEVIPGHLAVLSINTLYLFQSNPLVDSCDRKKDPGYKLFLWLGYTLKELRKRNMKVWLTGHVPPTAKNYDISCLRKYILWSHEYRDVIIGGLYGHMNIDHFLPLDSVQAYRSMEQKFRRLGELVPEPELSENSTVEAFDSGSINFDKTLEEMYSTFNSSIYNDNAEDALGFEMSFRKNIRIEGGVPSNKVDFMQTVRDSMYATIKGKRKSGKFGERYSIAHVSPSVVPTFNPSLRVWEYNITDLYDKDSASTPSWDVFLKNLDDVLEDETNDVFVYAEDDFADDQYEITRRKKRDKTIPPKMPSNKELGPAYTRQLFTPERYVQYYLDLKAVNNGDKDFNYEIEYTTDKDYRMKDLTVNEWLKFGRKLGRAASADSLITESESNSDLKSESSNERRAETKFKISGLKLWKKYLRHAFVSSDYENMGLG